MNTIKLKLKAQIYNHEQLIEACKFLQTIEYNGQFNKRFETYLNEESSKVFGTQTIKGWGMNGEDKVYPKVNFYFRKSDFQLTDEPKYELSINYDGQEAGYNYDSKETELRKRSQNEKLFGLKDVEEVKMWAGRIVENRTEGIELMQANIKNFAKLEHERLALKVKIEAYNKKISYAVSDEMRIK